MFGSIPAWFHAHLDLLGMMRIMQFLNVCHTIFASIILIFIFDMTLHL